MLPSMAQLRLGNTQERPTFAPFKIDIRLPPARRRMRTGDEPPSDRTVHLTVTNGWTEDLVEVDSGSKSIRVHLEGSADEPNEVGIDRMRSFHSTEVIAELRAGDTEDLELFFHVEGDRENTIKYAKVVDITGDVEELILLAPNLMTYLQEE